MKNWSLFILLLLSLVLCGYATYFYYDNFSNNGISQDTANWGTFGDYIGGVLGTIISLISAILIYITYKNQVENSTLQQFESSFFNLLSIQHEIVRNIKANVKFTCETNTKEVKGLEFFEVMEKELDCTLFDIEEFSLIYVEKYDNTKKDKLNKAKTEYLNIIKEKYTNVIYVNHKHILGHYFRHLYHMIKYVDESLVSNKKKYIDIIQAQLSDNELVSILINSLSAYGLKKMHPLLDKYSFFENIYTKGEHFDKMKIICFPNTKFKNLDWCYYPLIT